MQTTTSFNIGDTVYFDEIHEGKILNFDNEVAKLQLPRGGFVYRNTSDLSRVSRREFVELTEEGVSRVLDSCKGMVFCVKNVTENGDRRIVHVIDDRYEPEAIWSLGPEHYIRHA